MIAPISVVSSAEAGRLARKKAIIVTPDCIGPIKNGGIGTHCHYLARWLRRELDWDVTILFTEDLSLEGLAQCQQMYRQYDIEFDILPRKRSHEGVAIYGGSGDEYVRRSHDVYEYLLGHPADVVHFQDWRGNGFRSIQAKRCGLGFQNTRLIVTAHSSTEWQHEGGVEWYWDGVHYSRVAYCERYCCEHADELVAPSRHIRDWMVGKGWKLASKETIIPLLAGELGLEVPAHRAVDKTRLLFFGRLETRKGLELFCAAVRELMEDENPVIERVEFVGKLGTAGGQSAAEYIKQQAARWCGLPWKLVTDLDSFEAQKYLVSSGGLVVIPSLLDNSPYTVIECILNQIPCITTKVGGIPELVDDYCLFEPTAVSLADKVRSFDTGRPLLHKYSLREAERGWRELHERETVIAVPPEPRTPLVSVCVANFNHERYLPELLESLNHSTYRNFEVIVVDDCSTSPMAKQVLEMLARTKMRYTSQFFTLPQNGGVEAARNFAVTKAQGEYVVFMDADNLATPEMLEVFVTGMERSGVDCLCCFFSAFSGGSTNIRKRPKFIYAPVGPCPELAWLENLLGDANFIIRKSVFEEAGGFRPRRDCGWEDWELLLRLALRGYKMDVVPRSLIHYRHESRNRSGLHEDKIYDMQSRMRILQAYAEEMQQHPWVRRLFIGILGPSFFASRSFVPNAKPSKLAGPRLQAVMSWGTTRILSRKLRRSLRKRLSEMQTWFPG